MLDWLIQPLQAFFTWIGDALQSIVNVFGSILHGIGWLIERIIWVFTEAIRIGWQNLMWLLNGIGSLISGAWGWVQGAAQTVGEVFEIAGLLVRIIVAFFQVIGAYLGQVITITTQIFTGLTSATPTAIPGLPRCVSAPAEYDLCALWYVMEHTLFKGEIGDAILLVVILMIDISIVFYVIKSALRMIKVAQGVTDVA